MVIKFQKLQDHLKLQCLQKYDFKDYTKFCQSSYFALTFSKVVKKSLPINLDNWIIKREEELKTLAPVLEEPVKIWFKTIIFKIRLTDEIYLSVLPFFKKQWSTEKIKFEKKVKCRPILFNKLVLHSKATILSGSMKAEIPADNLRHAVAVHKLTDLHVSSRMTDDDVLELKSPRLLIRNSLVTAEGINAILKQWLSGKRFIDDLNIMGHFPREHDHDLLPGIPVLDPDTIYYEIKGDIFPNSGIFPLISDSSNSRLLGITKGEEHLLIDVTSQRVWIKPVPNFDKYFNLSFKPVLCL